jgi:hypothetical protein
MFYPNEPTICAGADMKYRPRTPPPGGGTLELYRLLTHARNLIDSMGTRSSNASIPFKRPLMVEKTARKVAESVKEVDAFTRLTKQVVLELA